MPIRTLAERVRRRTIHALDRLESWLDDGGVPAEDGFYVAKRPARRESAEHAHDHGDHDHDHDGPADPASLAKAVDAVRARREAPVSPWSGGPVTVENAERSPASPDAAFEPITGVPTFDAVQALLEEDVRPSLRSDGGDIELIAVRGADVHVRLVGACSSCPSSTITMRQGIERLLREEFPAMGALVEV